MWSSRVSLNWLPTDYKLILLSLRLVVSLWSWYSKLPQPFTFEQSNLLVRPPLLIKRPLVHDSEFRSFSVNSLYLTPLKATISPRRPPFPKMLSGRLPEERLYSRLRDVFAKRKIRDSAQETRVRNRDIRLKFFDTGIFWQTICHPCMPISIWPLTFLRKCCARCSVWRCIACSVAS